MISTKICIECNQSFFDEEIEQEQTLCPVCLLPIFKKEKLQKKIWEYCEDNPIYFYWDYRDELNRDQILTIIKKGIDGINDVENDIYESNLDYIFRLENEFKRENIFDNFKDEISEYLIEFNLYTQEELDDNNDIIKDFILDDLDIYPIVNINII